MSGQAVCPRQIESSLSYSRPSPRLTRQADAAFYDGAYCQRKRRNAMNTIIYIVGLIVVIGFILSFFGLG